MPEEFLTEQELLERWKISRPDLQALISEGLLRPVLKAGKRTFSEHEVTVVEESGRLDLGKPEEKAPELEGAPAGEGAEGEDLFGFGEEEEGQELEEEPAREARAHEEEPSEGEMITEVLEVGDDEMAEEDLLGDIIEDIGAEDDEVTPDEGITAEPTAELEVADDVTAEISQLGEETFKGEEIEEILAGGEPAEIGIGEGEEEELMVPVGAPVAREEALPVPVWSVVVLVVSIVLLAIGGMYLMGNAVSPQYSPTWLSSMNPFSSK